MASLKIKSRNTGETFDFWMPDQGGYISLESAAHPGRSVQICSGGHFRGPTLSAHSEDEFKKKCRSWYRSYSRLMKEYN